jgi:flagella basal body P-ring formation protein FlgA
MSTVPASAILSIEEAVGMIARKTIFPNQPLTTRHIEPRTVVKRNQLVPVEMLVGALRVQTRAQALSNARAGDFILLQNPGNKQQFQGIVRADGVVIVP